MFSELLLCFLIFFIYFFRFAFAFVICYFVFRIRICFALLGHRGLQSANHLIMVGTSERESFGSVRDFRAQSACVSMYIYCI